MHILVYLYIAVNIILVYFEVSDLKKNKLNILPGIVLSKMKATEPPTNMAVVRRTFNTWSISTMPEKDKETGA